MSENTETLTELDHDAEGCEHPEMIVLTVRRAPDTEPAEGEHIASAACSVEVLMHMHTEAELRTVVGVLQETQQRIEAHLLLAHLKRNAPNDLIAEMLDALGGIVVVAGLFDDREGEQ